MDGRQLLVISDLGTRIAERGKIESGKQEHATMGSGRVGGNAATVAGASAGRVSDQIRKKRQARSQNPSVTGSWQHQRFPRPRSNPHGVVTAAVEIKKCGKGGASLAALANFCRFGYGVGLGLAAAARARPNCEFCFPFVRVLGSPWRWPNAEFPWIPL